jgi:hypothetical protein
MPAPPPPDIPPVAAGEMSLLGTAIGAAFAAAQLPQVVSDAFHSSDTVLTEICEVRTKP